MRLTNTQIKNNRSHFTKTASALLAAVLLLTGCGRRAARDKAEAEDKKQDAAVETQTAQTGSKEDKKELGTEIEDTEEKDLMKELLKESIDNFNARETYYMTGTHISDDESGSKGFIYEFIEPGVLHYTYNISNDKETAMISESYYQDINSPEDMDRNILPDDVDRDSIKMPSVFYNDKKHATVYNDIYTGEPLSEEVSEQETGEERTPDETVQETENTESDFIPYTRQWLHVVEKGDWSMSEMDKYENPYANVLTMLLQRYGDVKAYTDDDYVVYAYTIKHPSTAPFAAYIGWNTYAFVNDEPIELNVVVSKSNRAFISASTESKTETGGTERFTVTVD